MAATEPSSRLSLLLEAGAALAVPDPGAAQRRLLAVLADGLDAEAAVLALQEDNAPEALHIAAIVGAPVPRGDAVRVPLDGIAAQVIRSGRPVTVPRVGHEPLARATSILPSRGRKAAEASLVCVPVPVAGRTSGVLLLVLRFQSDRDYGADAAAAQVAASMAGQAVALARWIAADPERLLDENRQLRDELRGRYELPNLIGTSHAMERVYEAVAQAAPANTTVLLRGESGTGKELVAHALHYASPRASGPFVKVNCAALPEALIESELFGYEPGAFTDARSRKKGRFELADGGTLFLDEIGELSHATQVKLLRVLQEREMERLGGVAPVRVDVRLVAATNRDLEAAVRAGAFREDLYYRLNVFEIFLPPLRERKTDVLLLADHFVQKYARAHGRDVRRLSTSAIDMLMAYHWPGNVRELENCIERALLVCQGGVVHGHHLPPSLQTAEGSGTLPQRALADAVAAFERDLMLDALKSARGNRAQAARLLQTTERIFNYKARRHGLDAARFKL